MSPPCQLTRPDAAVETSLWSSKSGFWYRTLWQLRGPWFDAFRSGSSLARVLEDETLICTIQILMNYGLRIKKKLVPFLDWEEGSLAVLE